MVCVRVFFFKRNKHQAAHAYKYVHGQSKLTEHARRRRNSNNSLFNVVWAIVQ